jgi:hypothetical protein
MHVGVRESRGWVGVVNCGKAELPDWSYDFLCIFHQSGIAAANITNRLVVEMLGESRPRVHNPDPKTHTDLKIFCSLFLPLFGKVRQQTELVHIEVLEPKFQRRRFGFDSVVAISRVHKHRFGKH